MKSMYIGSGDTSALLSGKNTATHSKLLQKFVSGSKPYYNAKASPIDAFRTGAILEERYSLILPDNYYEQHISTCQEMDVMRSSLDFAKLENGNVIDFEELKTCNFDDYLKIQKSHESNDLDYVKKTYKNNYNQVQFQLLCSGLKHAKLVFLVVYTYDDEVNYDRNIKESEYVKFKIERDEEVIYKIMERATPFQTIKDYYIS